MALRVCQLWCQSIYLHTSLTILLGQKILPFNNIVVFDVRLGDGEKLTIRGCGLITVLPIINKPV